MRLFYLRLFLSRQLIVDPLKTIAPSSSLCHPSVITQLLFAKRRIVILAISTSYILSSALHPPVFDHIRCDNYAVFRTQRHSLTLFPSIAIYFQAGDAGAVRVGRAAMQ